MLIDKKKFDILTKTNEWAYGMGHFLNDLTAACWFNFLLVYLTDFNIDSRLTFHSDFCPYFGIKFPL